MDLNKFLVHVTSLTINENQQTTLAEFVATLDTIIQNVDAAYRRAVTRGDEADHNEHASKREKGENFGLATYALFPCHSFARFRDNLELMASWFRCQPACPKMSSRFSGG